MSAANAKKHSDAFLKSLQDSLSAQFKASEGKTVVQSYSFLLDDAIEIPAALSSADKGVVHILTADLKPKVRPKIRGSTG